MRKRIHVTEYRAQGHMSVCVRDEVLETREGNVPRKTPKQKPNKSYFYLISGRKVPTFLYDADGEPAVFESAEEAREAASSNLMCMSIGYIVIEMSDTGPVGKAT